MGAVGPRRANRRRSEGRRGNTGRRGEQLCREMERRTRRATRGGRQGACHRNDCEAFRAGQAHRCRHRAISGKCAGVDDLPAGKLGQGHGQRRLGHAVRRSRLEISETGRTRRHSLSCRRERHQRPDCGQPPGLRQRCQVRHRGGIEAACNGRRENNRGRRIRLRCDVDRHGPQLVGARIGDGFGLERPRRAPGDRQHDDRH